MIDALAWAGGVETPFKGNVLLRLTPEEARGIEAFLRELKPGIYIKCPQCDRMRIMQGDTLLGVDGPVCEGCHA